FLMPNPPVPAVPNMIVNESNRGIPPARRKIICSTESPRYILYSNRAVLFTLGTSLPTDGPGLSAFIRYMVLPPARGRIAMTKTRIPIPPIQCVKLLQKIRHLGSVSTSGRILDPVVVNPDTTSNKASIYDGIAPASTNGKAPNILSAI